MLGEGATQSFGVPRILQHQRALYIRGAVQAAGQFEVAGTDRAHLLENLLYLFSSHSGSPSPAMAQNRNLQTKWPARRSAKLRS